ncbi:MAG: phosphatase PAP2 family protein [Aeromicrobium sp.]|nr:phosphatase PAP2 family protein [Burkholderiales bacterium]
MLIELLADIAKLSLIIACAFAGLNVYAHRTHRDWAVRLTQRRLAVLAVLTLAVSGVKVIEDVVAKESGPVDEMIMWLVREYVPTALTGFFTLVILSGSAGFILPAALLSTAALYIARRHFEAVIMAVSMITAPLVIYVLKMIVDRSRPALWEAQWYWGSSFPSGHTLSTAAFSTAAALCVARIWPQQGNLAMSFALVWTSTVAVSRLVIGVHWPSDVLAAMCLGAFISLAISIALELRVSSLIRKDSATT